MTPLEKQITILLGLTKTKNVLDSIEHIKALYNIIQTTEQQRKDWADLCIKKQARIDELEQRQKHFEEEVISEDKM
jgi:hypothetical protein